MPTTNPAFMRARELRALTRWSQSKVARLAVELGAVRVGSHDHPLFPTETIRRVFGISDDKDIVVLDDGSVVIESRDADSEESHP